MQADDPNPAVRWQSITDWYAEFAAVPRWRFLAPMVELTAWVGEQSFAAALFPGTSHAALCVHVRPGSHPDLPFFSCDAQADGQMKFELWNGVGRSLNRRLVPLQDARATFAEFVGKLHEADAGVAEPTRPADSRT
jgi:hypothetical protein